MNDALSKNRYVLLCTTIDYNDFQFVCLSVLLFFNKIVIISKLINNSLRSVYNLELQEFT